MNLTPLKIYRKLNGSVHVRSPRAKYLIPPAPDRYGLRWLYQNRYRDICELMTIDRQPELFEYMHPKVPSTFSYFQYAFQSSKHYLKDHFYVLAITSPDHHIIGWVQFIRDPNRRLIKHFTKINYNSLVLEVAYAKLFQGEYRHVAQDGLRLSIGVLKRFYRHSPRHIYLTAYTDESNVASEVVLLKNDFQKLQATINYEGDPCRIWIKKIK